MYNTVNFEPCARKCLFTLQFTGTTIKDTWTKIRGVEKGDGGEEGWGAGEGGAKRQKTVLEQQ